MAKKRWKGGAAATTDVWTVTVGGTPALNQVYTVTIGYRSLTYTASGSDTNNTIATALQLALSGSTYGEFLEYTWTVEAAVITAKGNYAGVPGIISSSATGTGTAASVNTTPSQGPNDVSVALNWDTGALPAAGDDVFFDHTAIDGLWNLQHFNGIVFNSLTIDSTFQSGSSGDGTLGLPEQNTLHTSYLEYRQQFFQCAPTTCTVGDGSGNGSGRLKLDFGAAGVDLVVHGTGSSLDTGLEALLIRGTNAANVASVAGGSVGFAPFGDDSCTLATLSTSAGSNGAPSVRCGDGCAVTTLNMEDGTVLCQNAPTTINKYGGALTVMGGNVTTWNEYAGGSAYLGTGTISTLNSWAQVDFSQDSRSRTVTNATFYPGGGFNDPGATVTWTNAFLVDGQASDVALNWGRNRHVTIA